jgi:N-acetylneuraminic acid mutarotase
MRNKIIEVFLLIVLFTSTCTRHEKAIELPHSKEWQFVTPMPHGRNEHDAVVGKDGKIYVMGGMVYKVVKGFKYAKAFAGWMLDKYDDGRYSVLCYDPEKDSWKYLAPVPGAVIDFGIHVHDQVEDKWVYFTNQYVEELPGAIFMSDPATKTWKTIFTLPGTEGRYRLYNYTLGRNGEYLSIVGSSSGMIYWLGGLRNKDLVLSFDILNNEWSKVTRNPYKPTRIETVYETLIPNMQEGRSGHRAVSTSGDKIFVMGGYCNWCKMGIEHYVSDTLECYDPKIGKWEYKKPMFTKRMQFAAVTGRDGKIYLFGGAAGYVLEEKTPILDSTEVYDPKTDIWAYKKPIPAPRYSHAAALASDGRIYIIGGSETLHGPPLKTVWIYDPKNDEWQRGPDMAVPRAELAAVATVDGKIYAIGGTDGGAYREIEDIGWDGADFSKMPYNGKVQETVEVLDIHKMKKNWK